MKIAVIGAAGSMGSCAAFAIASHGLAEEIVLIDKNENLVRSQAMDIAASTVGQEPIRVRAGGAGEELSDSDLVIVTAGVHFDFGTPVEKMLSANTPIIREVMDKIAGNCPEAAVLIATNPLDPLTHLACRESGLNPRQILGYNLNDTIRFRMIVAETLGVPSKQVEVMVLGEHPGGLVPLFSSIRVDGAKIPIDESTKMRIRENLKKYLTSWVAISTLRSAVWTSAAGIMALVKAVRDNNGQILACSAWLEGEYGLSGLCLGVPAVIGRHGVHKVVEMDLADDERAELERIAAKVKSANEAISKYL